METVTLPKVESCDLCDEDLSGVRCTHVERRSKIAIESINLIPRYGGAIIHDGWSWYFAYPQCGHGLCGSHLLRELTFIEDAHGYRWAKNMKRLLQ